MHPFLALIAAMTIALFGSTQQAWAQESSSLVIDDVWGSPSIGGSKVGVAYFSATNTSEEDIAIIAVTSTASETVELHTHFIADDIMQMRKIEEVTVPAGHTVMAKPHALHLMLIDLNQPLGEGETYPVTFHLNNDKKVEGTLTIKPRPNRHGHHD